MWRVAVLICIVFVHGRPSEAARLILDGVPEYPNYHGCTPTSGAMILGYWDGKGYPDLLPGFAMPFRDEIGQFIASDRHLADYWVEWGSSAMDPWFTRHKPMPTTIDCLADAMSTSRYPTADGWTDLEMAALGLSYFSGTRNASYSFSARRRFALSFKDDFVEEINAGRPVMLFVKVGSTIDHVIVGYGYDNTDPAKPMFAAMDTYLGNPPGTIDWWPWSRVYGGVLIRPETPPERYPDGDVNGDWCVNIADLLTVRNCLGASGSDIISPRTDTNGDGIVNVADLLTVRNLLGSGPNCK